MKSKMCSIVLPIDQDIYDELSKHCEQLSNLKGMPAFTPESCITDAIVLHHVKPLNDFLRTYMSEKFGHYPKTKNEKGIPVLVSQNE